jgi:hypothetical protein
VSIDRNRSLLRDPLDRRTRVGRAYLGHIAALRAHVGGEAELTPPLARLVDQAARLALLSDLCWATLASSGPFSSTGDLVPAFAAYERAAAAEQRTLQLLGLDRRAKIVPSLSDIMAEIAAEDARASTSTE